jgi:hypothetical protein
MNYYRATSSALNNNSVRLSNLSATSSVMAGNSLSQSSFKGKSESDAVNKLLEMLTTEANGSETSTETLENRLRNIFKQDGGCCY